MWCMQLLAMRSTLTPKCPRPAVSLNKIKPKRLGWTLSAALVLATTCCSARLGQAQTTPRANPLAETLTCQNRGPPQVALVVSGGVSLGAYQAGFLHYFTEYLKRLEARETGSPIIVATGASAGSLNTSLAALETCRAIEKTIWPERSLFFKIWHDLRIEALFPADGRSVRFNAVLDREPLELAADRVKDYVSVPSEAWRRNCTTDLGFVATRLSGREVPLRVDAPSLTLNRLTEKFVMSFDTGSASGPKTLRFGHFAIDAPTGPKLWLRPGKAGASLRFEDYRDVLFASTAFPVAFSPIQVTFHEADSTKTEQASFIDGGVFENVPVRLAAMVVNERRKRQPPALTIGNLQLPKPVTYVVLSTDVTNFGRDAISAAERQEPESLPELVGDFAADFLTASRAAELLSVVDENKNLQSLQRNAPTQSDGCDRIEMPVRRQMLASDHLLGFLGFLDENFRSLDFYLGMLDARRYVSRPRGKTKGDFYSARKLSTVVQAVDAAIVSPQLECLKRLDGAYWPYEKNIDVKVAHEVCGPRRFAASRELLKVLSANIATTQKLIDAQLPMDDAKAFGFFIDALDERDFNFTFYAAEGVNKVPAAEVPGWLRSNLDRVVGLIAREQPTFLSRLTTSTALRLAANELVEHADPPAVFSLGPNANRGLDLSYDMGLGRSLQHRLGFGVRIRGLDFVGCSAFCISSFGTFEYRYSLGDALASFWSLEFGVEGGAGYVRNDSGDYPAWLAGASVTGTLLHRVYLRGDIHWTPKVDFASGRTGEFTFGLGLGVRFHDVRNLR